MTTAILIVQLVTLLAIVRIERRRRFRRRLGLE